jgi:hypothetical protein
MAKRTPTPKRKIPAPKKRAPWSTATNHVWRFYACNGDFLGDLTFSQKEMSKYFPKARYDGSVVYLA